MSQSRALARLRLPCVLGRTLTTTAPVRATETSPQHDAPNALDLDPNTVLPEFEQQLMQSGKTPIGSRRRRVAMRTSQNMPFEQLPYQAFQEARAILAADREEKLGKIRATLAKISHLEGKQASASASPSTAISTSAASSASLDTKLASLRRYLDELKILADVNDPLVKKRFEDGLGDMTKPIYRYYAERKWRSYNHRLIRQRISQFSIVPDVLPKLDPIMDVQLFFRATKVPPGQFVDSLTSENPPRLRVQSFDRATKLVSLVVLDCDVPDPLNDRFAKRCHFLAVNIPLGPTHVSMPLGAIRAPNQLVLPWLPPTAQKGSPYHRLAVLLLEQRGGGELDADRLRSLYAARDDGFSVKSLRDKFALAPIGFTMFRSQWDDNSAAVMARHAISGADIELRPTRVHSLKPPVKPRGWEAKRQGPAYRHLWKYTKRIRGLSNGRRWTKRR